MRDTLGARIGTGALRPGQRLDPEPELAASLGVSRATLREALRSLEEEGRITRTRGAGTYVTHRPRLRNNLDRNFGVTDLIRSMGMRPGTEGFASYLAQATAEEAEQLAIEPASSVMVVERTRLADGRPVVFSRDIVPSALLEGHEGTVQRLHQESIYAVLEADLGLVVRQGVASIHPLAAPRWLATRLRIHPRSQILYLRQVDFLADGRPVLLSHEYHLADAFEITVLRRGPGPSVRGAAGRL